MSSKKKTVKTGNSSTEGIESLSLLTSGVTLISSDMKSFQVATQIASESETIKNLIEDGCAEDGIPLPNVTGDTLGKVIEFCKQHVFHKSSNKQQEDLSKWDASFVKQFDESQLFDLVLAVHYLNIKDLYELMCQAIADVAKTKKPDDILKMFNITKDTKFEN